MSSTEKGAGSMGDGSSKEGATVVAGEVLGPKEQTTERGLKSRHAQMIALGGKKAFYLSTLHRASC